MIKGAIFDMDGTLTCSTHIWDGITERYFEDNGYTLPDNYWDILRERRYTFVEAMEFCIDLFGLTKDPETLIYEQYQYIKDAYIKVGLKPGVAEYLQYLKENGIKCCVATLANDYIADDVLNAHGIFDHFEFILSAATENTSKRDPDLFLKAAHLLGLDPSECAVYEDSAMALQTAKDAGFSTVGVFDQNTYKQPTPACDTFITSFKELIK